MRLSAGGRLRHRRLQTALAVAALGSAVALPVVLLSVGGGVFEHELAQLTESGYELAVGSGGVHGVDSAHALVGEIRALPDVAYASPVLSGSLELYGPSGASAALAEGVIPSQFSGTLVASEAPLFPDPLPLGDPGDTVHFANGSYDGPSAGRVLVSTPIAASDRLAVGDEVRLSADSNLSDAVAFTVAGTFGVAGPSIGSTAVFGVVLPLSDLQLLLGVAHGPEGTVRDASDSIEVALAPGLASDPGAVNDVAQRIRALVPYYTVTSVNDEAAQLENAQAVLTGFYLGLSAVGLVVGLAFLALLLEREVEMDRRAIGVRRALGVPRRDIALGILARGYGLAAAGTATGLAVGILLVTMLARWASGTVATVARLATFAPVTLGGLALLVIAASGVSSALAVRSALRASIPELLR